MSSQCSKSPAGDYRLIESTKPCSIGVAVLFCFFPPKLFDPSRFHRSKSTGISHFFRVFFPDELIISRSLPNRFFAGPFRHRLAVDLSSGRVVFFLFSSVWLRFVSFFFVAFEGPDGATSFGAAAGRWRGVKKPPESKHQRREIPPPV